MKFANGKKKIGEKRKKQNLRRITLRGMQSEAREERYGSLRRKRKVLKVVVGESKNKKVRKQGGARWESIPLGPRGHPRTWPEGAPE